MRINKPVKIRYFNSQTIKSFSRGDAFECHIPEIKKAQKLTHVVNKGNLSITSPFELKFIPTKEALLKWKSHLDSIEKQVNSPWFILRLAYSRQKALMRWYGCTQQELLKKKLPKKILGLKVLWRSLMVVQISFCRIGFSVQVFDTLATVWWRNCGVWHELRRIVKNMLQQMALIRPYFVGRWKTEHYATIHSLCLPKLRKRRKKIREEKGSVRSAKTDEPNVYYECRLVPWWFCFLGQRWKTR